MAELDERICKEVSDVNGSGLFLLLVFLITLLDHPGDVGLEALVAVAVDLEVLDEALLGSLLDDDVQLEAALLLADLDRPLFLAHTEEIFPDSLDFDPDGEIGLNCLVVLAHELLHKLENVVDRESDLFAFDDG
jgi:hypothetical protein